MMDFKTVVAQFKSKHLQAGKQLSFSLLPLLMNELIANGLNISHANGQFYQELAEELFNEEPKELQLYAIDALVLCGQSIPAPKAALQPKKEAPKVEAIIENDIIRTEHLVNDIPNEDDEGDPFYIPPEERINLRPEDFAPMEYDEEFCKLAGIDISKRQNR